MTTHLTTDKALATLNAIHSLCVQKLKAELNELTLEERLAKINNEVSPQELVNLVEDYEDGCWDYVLVTVLMAFADESKLLLLNRD